MIWIKLQIDKRRRRTRSNLAHETRSIQEETFRFARRSYGRPVWRNMTLCIGRNCIMEKHTWGLRGVERSVSPLLLFHPSCGSFRGCWFGCCLLVLKVSEFSYNYLHVHSSIEMTDEPKNLPSQSHSNQDGQLSNFHHSNSNHLRATTNPGCLGTICIYMLWQPTSKTLGTYLLHCVQLDTFFRVIIKDKLLSCLLPICYILVDPPPLTCCAMETPKISLAPSIVSHFARSPRKSRQLNSANNSHEALGRFRRRIIDTLDSGKFKPVAPTFPGRVLISRVRWYSRSSLRIVSLTTVLTVVSLTDRENNFAAKLVRKLGLIHSFLPNLG